MARKKSPLASSMIEHTPPSTAPAPTPELPPNFAEQYKAMVDKPNTRGRLSPYKPTFVPPGVKLILVSNPVTDADKAHYREMEMQGWMPLAANLATDDTWKAMENNLVSFPFFTERDGLVQVGPYVVMWKPMKDYMESYLADINRILNTSTPQNVELMEDRSEESQANVIYRNA